MHAGSAPDRRDRADEKQGQPEEQPSGMKAMQFAGQQGQQITSDRLWEQDRDQPGFPGPNAGNGDRTTDAVREPRKL